MIQRRKLRAQNSGAFSEVSKKSHQVVSKIVIKTRVINYSDGIVSTQLNLRKRLFSLFIFIISTFIVRMPLYEKNTQITKYAIKVYCNWFSCNIVITRFFYLTAKGFRWRLNMIRKSYSRAGRTQKFWSARYRFDSQHFAIALFINPISSLRTGFLLLPSKS